MVNLFTPEKEKNKKAGGRRGQTLRMWHTGEPNYRVKVSEDLGTEHIVFERPSALEQQPRICSKHEKHV